MNLVQTQSTRKMLQISSHLIRGAVSVGIFGICWVACRGLDPPPAQAVQTPPATSQSPINPPRPRYRPARFSKRAEEYYGLIWGVDSLSVKWAESGEVIRFSYRILDAAKAKPLNDKRNEPILVDPQAGVKLIVPSLEKVGQLRQSGTPEEGKVYWMAFSNKGHVVQRGSRVNVVIGEFRAEGLVVD